MTWALSCTPGIRCATVASAGLLAALVVVPAAPAARDVRLDGARPAGSTISPDRFRQVSSGIAYVTTFNCRGRKIGTGTGFLVGESVVMTARHVLQRSCRIRVKVSGERFRGVRWVYWRTSRRSSGLLEDLATLKLDRAASGHVFRFRTSPPPAGTNLAMIGYPLGNRISLNQGKIIRSQRVGGVPLMAVRMLGAEGASGSPFVDDAGRVVGILQQGLGSEDVLRQRTAGVLVGIDLSRWWGAGARRDLCRAYPRGGIAGCPGARLTPDVASQLADSAQFELSNLGGDWQLDESGEISFGGRCAEYEAPNGVLANSLEWYSHPAGYVLSHGVLVYETRAGAADAYDVTTSLGNFECFGEGLGGAIAGSLTASQTLEAYSYDFISAPRFGEASSAGMVTWTVSDSADGTRWTGRLYWIDVLSGYAYRGFQLIAFDDAPLITNLQSVLNAVVAQTRR